MALLGENPHIRNVVISDDPQDDNPEGYCVIVDTDLDVASTDPEERKRIVALLAAVNDFLGCVNPGLTKVTLHSV